ncbi:unnamed protein product [Urochloa decumbens]|uniref:Uncharacterized protein n=1 Tax=Urochloa decumbens TaxID=240449 RepID=A0ABC8WHB5_9POAL
MSRLNDPYEDRYRPPPWYNDHPERMWDHYYRRDVHDDDDGHSGHPGVQARSTHDAKCVGQETAFRERGRSPRQCSRGTDRGSRCRVAPLPSPVATLPDMRDLQAEREAELRFLFKAQAGLAQDMVNTLLKNYSTGLSHELVIPTINNYICNAEMLAEKLGLADVCPLLQIGYDALSGTTAQRAPLVQVGASTQTGVPVPEAYQRLKHSLCTAQEGRVDEPTREQVEEVLNKMQAAASWAPHTTQQMCRSPGQPASPCSPRRHSQADNDYEDHLGLSTFFTTPPPPAIRAELEAPRQVQTHNLTTPRLTELQQSATPGDNALAAGVGAIAPMVDDLFVTPAPPLIEQKPARRLRQKRTFDMTSVLRDYINSIQGPAPDFTIAALTTLLDLDDDDAAQLTDALLQHAGDEVADLQAEQDGLMCSHA